MNTLAQTSQTVSPSIPQIEDDSPMPPLHEVEAELHTPVPPHQTADVPVADAPTASPVDPAIFAERPQSSSPSPTEFSEVHTPQHVDSAVSAQPISSPAETEDIFFPSYGYSYRCFFGLRLGFFGTSEPKLHFLILL